ncbi:MAG: LPS assembly protein LptD, partial [Pseudomonadota bacterium]
DTQGLFELTDDIDWGWDITFTSDDAYLSRFSYTFPDRLDSEIFIRSYRQDGYFDVAGVYFQSLCDNEPAGQIPLSVPVLDAQYHFDESVLDGQITLSTSGYALRRTNGQDVSRLSVGAGWERSQILPVGLQLTAFAEVRGDLFLIEDHPTITDSTAARFQAQGGVEARFPLIAESKGGVRHLFEPVVQAVVAPYGGNGADFPVEDSLVTEFDETNVIDRTHFSGLDSVEEGPRLNVLLRYDRIDDDGLSLDATIGRVFRLKAANAFSAGSGLSGTESDFVAAWGAAFDPYVRVQHRMRVADDMTINRNEFFGEFAYGPATLNVGYVFLGADPQTGATLDREEVQADASFGLDENWTVSAFMQRDLTAQQFVQFGGALTYANECCSVDFFVKREETNSTNSPASTSFGAQIRLLTLGDADTR